MSAKKVVFISPIHDHYDVCKKASIVNPQSLVDIQVF